MGNNSGQRNRGVEALSGGGGGGGPVVNYIFLFLLSCNLSLLSLGAQLLFLPPSPSFVIPTVAFFLYLQSSLLFYFSQYLQPIWLIIIVCVTCCNTASSNAPQITLFSKGAALQRTNTEYWKQISQEKELRGLSPNFHIHVSVSDLYIPTIDLPILLHAGNMCTDLGNV
jgi:hypothetical protein